MMHYRALGNTGLNVSEIGMGCEGFAENDYKMCRELFDLEKAMEFSGILRGDDTCQSG